MCMHARVRAAAGRVACSLHFFRFQGLRVQGCPVKAAVPAGGRDGAWQGPDQPRRDCGAGEGGDGERWTGGQRGCTMPCAVVVSVRVLAEVRGVWWSRSDMHVCRVQKCAYMQDAAAVGGASEASMS